MGIPLKLPTWEASKEIADKLPGEKSGEKEGDKCETCGTPLDKEGKKGR